MRKEIISEIKQMQKLMLYNWAKTDTENTQIFEQIIGDPPSDAGGGGNTGGGTGSGNRPSAPAIQIPSELANAEGVKKFQDWLDANKPGWATGYADGKVNKGRGYGRFGPRTSKAWTTHKDAYLNPVVADTDVMAVDDFQGADAVYSSTEPTTLQTTTTNTGTQTPTSNTGSQTVTNTTAVPLDGTAPTNAPIEPTDKLAPDAL